MAIDIKFDTDKKFLVITVEGELVFDEFASATQTITSSTNFPADTNAIWDMRKSNFHHADAELWRQFIEYRAGFTQRANCKAAIIVAGDFEFGMSRMFQMLAEHKIHMQIQVFRDMAAGERWMLQDQPHAGA